MTKHATYPLTHDAAIALLIENAEANLEALLMVNGALTCLSKVTLYATENDQIVIPDLGCLIWLCDKQTDELVHKMLLQHDQHRHMVSPKIEPAIL